MKIIDLLNKISNGEEVPRIIKYDLQTYYFRNYDYKEYDIEKDFIDEQTSFIEDKFDFYKLNDEVEIIEEEKKITPTDFENLGYALGSIRKYINKGYDKAIEEKKIPEKLNLDKDELRGKETPRAIDYLIEGKINEVIDYLKSKGDE